MLYYPNRKTPAFLGIITIIICCGLLYLTFNSFGFSTAILSLVFFGLFVFFIFPVIKNQVVDVKDNHIIIYNFGKGFELSQHELFEILNRKGGILSYRFQKGDLRFQISPLAYYEGKLLQANFSKLFLKPKK